LIQVCFSVSFHLLAVIELGLCGVAGLLASRLIVSLATGIANDSSDETVLRGLEMGWHSPVFTLGTSFLALYLNRVSRIIGFVDSVTDLSVVSDVGSLFPSTTAMAMVLKAQ
jgi:hypothetical protein